MHILYDAQCALHAQHVCNMVCHFAIRLSFVLEAAVLQQQMTKS